MFKKRNFKIALLIIFLIIIIFGIEYIRYNLNIFDDPNIDCSLNQNQRFGFYKTENNVCYGYFIGVSSEEFEYVAFSIRNIDFNSFEAINRLYAKDKNYVYYAYKIRPELRNYRGMRVKLLDDVDLGTFEVLDDIYSKDKNYVF